MKTPRSNFSTFYFKAHIQNIHFIISALLTGQQLDMSVPRTVVDVS